MKQHFFPVILGTARAERKSAAVADFVVSELSRLGLKSELIDVAHFDLSFTRQGRDTADIVDFRSTIDSADGIVVVSPEYNHSYPGELKLLLDEGGEEFNRKPVGFVGVSAGGLGGSRVIEALRLVALAFRMVPVADSVFVSRVSSDIDEGGIFSSDRTAGAIEKMAREMAWFADALTPARDSL
ncbi:MAG: NAD(P)H-dependent oxidoreductase [Acidimicrobiia bacterium]|nr:NAD(P)H-dependent oxidoreductase [Acidimicrobiia bacterium]